MDLMELRREREREGLLLVKEQRIREEGEFMARREMEERKEQREKRKAEMEEAEHAIKMKIYKKMLSVLEVITLQLHLKILIKSDFIFLTQKQFSISITTRGSS